MNTNAEFSIVPCRICQEEKIVPHGYKGDPAGPCFACRGTARGGKVPDTNPVIESGVFAGLRARAANALAWVCWQVGPSKPETKDDIRRQIREYPHTLDKVPGIGAKSYDEIYEWLQRK